MAHTSDFLFLQRTGVAGKYLFPSRKGTKQKTRSRHSRVLLHKFVERKVGLVQPSSVHKAAGNVAGKQCARIALGQALQDCVEANGLREDLGDGVAQDLSDIRMQEKRRYTRQRNRTKRKNRYNKNTLVRRATLFQRVSLFSITVLRVVIRTLRRSLIMLFGWLVRWCSFHRHWNSSSALRPITRWTSATYEL